MTKVIPSVETLTGGTANSFLLAGGAGVPTVQETAAQVKTRLDLSGTNTGDQDLSAYATTVFVAANYQPIGSYAAASHTHNASAITDFAEAVDDEVATLLVAGTNITLTYNDAGNSLTIASTAAGIGGSTGATDNRLLRSDGTGGATLQSSAITVDDSGNISGAGTVACGPITLTQANTFAAATTQGLAIKTSDNANAGNIAFRGNSFGQLGIWGPTQLLSAVPIMAMSGNTITFGATLASASSFTFANRTDLSSTPGFIVSGGGGTMPVVRLTGYTSQTADYFQCFTVGNATKDFSVAPGGAVGCGTITSIGLIRTGVYTVATLPSASANAGFTAQVTDSSVTTFRSTVAAGGANRVMVFSDGTNWLVM